VMWKAIIALAAVLAVGDRSRGSAWSTDELRTIESLSIRSLGPPPMDLSNRIADDPRAAALGKSLFFDPRFSSNGYLNDAPRGSCCGSSWPQRNLL
jgi:cytochrome c peroxidase